MQQQKNLVLFIVLAILVTIAWMDLRNRFFAPPKVEPAKTVLAPTLSPTPPAALAAGSVAAFTTPGLAPGLTQLASLKRLQHSLSDAKPAPKERAKAIAGQPAQAPSVPPVTEPGSLIHLGSAKRDHSPYQLGVTLDPLGAGVRSVVLNKFLAADAMGRPTTDPLELVPAGANEDSPSYLLYNFDVHDPNDDRPLDALGRALWQHGPVQEEKLADGRMRQSLSFWAEIQGVRVTKTYSLTQGDYHLGLEVKLKRDPGATDNNLQFRYQLTGAHGLPVEGRWYTNTFQNALIGRVNERGNVDRDFQDLRRIVLMGGGNKVSKEPGLSIRYACEAVQYFATGIVVDDQQARQDFLASARPTLAFVWTAGQVGTVAPDLSNFVLQTRDHHDEIFYVDKRDRAHFAGLTKGAKVLVQHYSASYNEQLQACPQIATEWREGELSPSALGGGDITVRVNTQPVELVPGAEVVHKYLLYSGPIKVSQLYGMEGVSSELVDRYHDNLHLNTLTDYQSPGPLGTFSSTVGFTWLVIKCTNVMHSVLGFLHMLVHSYGLCIILLTVLVRGLMFPVSRRQQMMTMKMQKLAPELKKLQEKFKDDRQQLGMAQMELYRKHGVNPFGSCWFLLLQMPIFMGLYFALQESIHFRLAPFWPTWITNLAAPDMLVYWGQKIPWISRPEDYGYFFYLGPYFNLLPVIAVILMIFQQKIMTPPPQDDQQAMQMKIMRYMMIFFGLMFYKVAAGLCIYFIASSVWGFAERRLLPKVKPITDGPISADALLARGLAGQPALASTGQAPSTGLRPAAGSLTTAAAGDRGRRRDRPRTRRRPDRPEPAESSPSGVGGWWRERRRRFSEWWAEVLEQARKR